MLRWGARGAALLASGLEAKGDFAAADVARGEAVAEAIVAGAFCQPDAEVGSARAAVAEQGQSVGCLGN